jgi:hypothetical protein
MKPNGTPNKMANTIVSRFPTFRNACTVDYKTPKMQEVLGTGRRRKLTYPVHWCTDLQ